MEEEERETEAGPVRAHGFELPYHSLQVISWVVFGVDVLLFSIFQIPLLDTTTWKVTVSICYATSVLILVLATFNATLSDPSDPHLCRVSEFTAEEHDELPFCTVCAVPVFARSKHCRACNKCVNVFDHHCMWLNNCIGASNYRFFAVAITSVAVMIGIVLSTCVYLLVDYFVNNEDFEHRLFSVVIFRFMTKEAYLGLLILMIIVNTPLFVLDVQLVIFHVFLVSQGLTTFEYIMTKRGMEQELELEEAGWEFQGQEDGKVFPAVADQRPPDAGHQPRLANHRIKTLPRCLDWIVFARCGKKRHKKGAPHGKDHIERIEGPEALYAVDDEAPRRVCPVDTSASPSIAAAAIQVEGQLTPTPPGSTADCTLTGGDFEAAGTLPKAGTSCGEAAADTLVQSSCAGGDAECAADFDGAAGADGVATPSVVTPSEVSPARREDELNQKTSGQDIPVRCVAASAGAKPGCGCDTTGSRPSPAPSRSKAELLS